MSLRYELNRGPTVSVPNSRRRLRGYFIPTPLKHEYHVDPIGNDKQLNIQLRRGHKVPDPRSRFINHDIAEQMSVQDHGIKVRLGDSSIEALKKPDLLGKIEELRPLLLAANAEEIELIRITIGLPPGTTLSVVIKWFENVSSGFIKPSEDVLKNVIHLLHNAKFMDKHRRSESITDAIDNASNTQLQALADIIGIPITDSIIDMRKNINNWFMDLYTNQLEPSLEKQNEIIALLEQIKGKDDIAAVSSKASTYKLPETVTPDQFQMWADNGTLNNKLKQLEQNAVTLGVKIIDDDKKFSNHRFIIGVNGNPITIDAVKINMKSGNFILNTKDFRLEKKSSPVS